MSETIKPLDWADVDVKAKCIKCGGDASPDIFTCSKDESNDLFAIRCDDDEGCGLITHLYKTIEEALKAWNVIAEVIND